MVVEKNIPYRTAVRESHHPSSGEQHAEPERESDGESSQGYQAMKRHHTAKRDPTPLWKRKIFTIPVKNFWPAPVKCKMNVTEWEELMRETGLEKEVEYITEGFKNGFCLGIPQHQIEGMKWYTPQNHKSAMQARQSIEQTLRKEKEAGRMVGPFTHEEVYKNLGFFRTNPMGGAINGDGSIRMVNDLSHPKKEKGIPSVNSLVDKLNYETFWDDFDTVALFFQENPGPWECAIFDWQKAYRQLPGHPCQRRFLCILDFEGQVWVDLAVGFGGVASCGVFGAPAHVWKVIMEHLLGFQKIFRWVDDNLILRRPGSPASLADVTTLSNNLGVETNPAKNHEFGDKQRYVGFIWNGKDHTVRLPEEKLRERTKLVVDLLSSETAWSFDQIKSCIGKLVHTVYIVPHMKAYMRSFYKWLKDRVNKSALRKTPAYVRADLEEWQRCLLTFQKRPLIPSPKAEEVGCTGDASSSFGIGVLIQESWACFELVQDWPTRDLAEGKRSIAWAETVAIRLGLLVLGKLRRVEGKKFYVWTDNTTLQSAVGRRKSKDEQVNEEWKEIQHLLTKLTCDIEAKRVTSKGNVADALSRGFLGSLQWYAEVKIEIPPDLEHLLKQVFPPKLQSAANK